MLACLYLVYITRCHCTAQNATLHNDSCHNNNKRLYLLLTTKVVERRLVVAMMSHTVCLISIMLLCTIYSSM